MSNDACMATSLAGTFPYNFTAESSLSADGKVLNSISLFSSFRIPLDGPKWNHKIFKLRFIIENFGNDKSAASPPPRD